MNQFTNPTVLRGSGSSAEDPLAELARIVGRKDAQDPFDTLLDDAHAAGAGHEGWSDEELQAADDEAGEYPPEEYQTDEYLADDFYAEGGDEAAGQAVTRRRGWGAAGMAAVVGLAVAGAGAGYAWKSGLLNQVALPSLGGTPPVITASTAPVKVVQPADTQASVDGGTREIFQRPGQAAAQPEHVVAREEQPVAIDSVTPPAPKPDTMAASASPSPGLPPEVRRVKTVKVLSDGRVVTGETVAPANTLPTGLPAAFGDDSAPVHTVTAMADPVPAMPVPDLGQQPAAVVPAVPQTASSLPEDPEPVVKPVAAKPQPAKPHVADAAKKLRVKPATTQVASLDPAVPAAASTGGFVVQIASQKTQADANATLHALQQRYGGVLGGLSGSIRSADLGTRGTYYRVRVGPMASRDAATSLCVKLKAAGGSCVVARN